MGGEGKHISEAEMQRDREAGRRHDELADSYRLLRESFDRAFSPPRNPPLVTPSVEAWRGQRIRDPNAWRSPKRRAHLEALRDARRLCDRIFEQIASGDPWLKGDGGPIEYGGLSHAVASLAAEHLRAQSLTVSITPPAPGSRVGHTLCVHDPFLDVRL